MVAERSREDQRLRWFLVELEIDEPAPESLDRIVVQERLGAALADRAEFVARFAREILARIVELSRAIRDLGREIERRIRPLAPALLKLVGCGPLTAAKIVVETGNVVRFGPRKRSPVTTPRLLCRSGRATPFSHDDATQAAATADLTPAAA